MFIRLSESDDDARPQLAHPPPSAYESKQTGIFTTAMVREGGVYSQNNYATENFMTNIIQMPDHVHKAEERVVQVDFSNSSTKLKEKNSSKISEKAESSSD